MGRPRQSSPWKMEEEQPVPEEVPRGQEFPAEGGSGGLIWPPPTHLAADTRLEEWASGSCPGLTSSLNLINTLLRSFHRSPSAVWESS